MLQYDNYNIFIHYPDQDLLRARYAAIEHYSKKKDFKKTAWLRNIAIVKDEIAQDRNTAPNPDRDAFQREVVRQLNKVAATPIGKVTLDSINREKPLYILPLTDHDGKSCPNCAAYVFEPTEEAGGGIRLHYIPTFYREGEVWSENDDQLYHELVHALRFSWGPKEKPKTINGYDDPEEFVATIMENLYISSRGGTRYYSRYRKPVMVGKREAYDIYANSADVLAALKLYSRTDAFLWAMSRRWDPPFNPWRDQPSLEKRWLASMAKDGVRQLPELF